MKPIILETYPGLEAKPWVGLGDFSTSIQRLEKLGKVIEFSNLYIKREDINSRKYGGNKVRNPTQDEELA